MLLILSRSAVTSLLSLLGTETEGVTSLCRYWTSSETSARGAAWRQVLSEQHRGLPAARQEPTPPLCRGGSGEVKLEECRILIITLKVAEWRPLDLISLLDPSQTPLFILSGTLRWDWMVGGMIGGGLEYIANRSTKEHNIYFRKTNMNFFWLMTNLVKYLMP